MFPLEKMIFIVYNYINKSSGVSAHIIKYPVNLERKGKGRPLWCFAMKTINRRIKVKDIRYVSDRDGYTVLIGTAMSRNRTTNTWSCTTKHETYTGYFTSLYVNDQVDVICQKVRNPFYGEQWEILCYQRIVPGTIEELRLFLSSHIHGLGAKRARQLTDRYGLDTISAICKDPTAMDFLPIKDAAKQKFRNEMLENQCFEQLLAQLMLYKVDYRYANQLYRKYKTDSVKMLLSNPYGILRDGIFDFQTAESIAFQQKVQATDPNRVLSVVCGCLKHDSEGSGSLYIPWKDIARNCEAFVKDSRSPYKKEQIPTELIDKVIQDEVGGNRVVVDYQDPEKPVYLAPNYWHEQGVLDGIERLRDGIKRFVYDDMSILMQIASYQAFHKISLAQEQQDAILMALKNPISIITGGPGTGKTQTIMCIIAAIKALSPSASIRLAAPTGKAAVRITQMCGQKAQTIHRLLGLFGDGLELNMELDCDFLIVDEFSMVDVFLCDRIVHKVSEHTRLILIGDHHQLPSVGPGLILRDMISSRQIPVTILKQVFRQAGTSTIVRNANALIQQEGKTPDLLSLQFSTQKTGDFYFLDAKNALETLHLVRRSIANLMTNRHFSLSEIQVLSPIHSGENGVDRLNGMFQDMFNPSNECVEFKDREFRVGDRVIHTQNNYELGVVNGEIGTVVRIGNDVSAILEVEYPDHQDPVIYPFSGLDELELAYAITIHKSQGSEFPAVIIPVTRSVMKGLNFNSIYTAWTRAKKVVVMVGDKQILATALQKSTIDERRSKLSEKLRGLASPDCQEN